MPEVSTRRGANFPETRWSKIARLSDRSPGSPEAGQALAELCELYWFPLYAFARRTGYAKHDAEDLTQAFFERLVDRKLFAQADRQRGRLRSFLLGVFRNFLNEQARNAHRLKRGGGRQFVPLDAAEAEAVYEVELTNSASPEEQFERSWARMILQNALSALEREYRARGQQLVFDVLHPALTLDGAPPIQANSQALGISPGAVRVSIHRLRQRFRRLLHEQIAETVASPQEVEDELRHLGRALAT